jgi:hypothetical protein
VRSLLRDSRLNLSQHKSLRELRFVALGFPTNLNGARDLQVINTLLSAVPSSSKLDLVLIYEGNEFSSDCAVALPDRAVHAGEPITKSSCECCLCIMNLGRLKVLAEAYRNRNFRLVLRVEARGEMAWDIMKALELQVGAHRDGDLRWLLSGSSIISSVPYFGSGYIQDTEE